MATENNDTQTVSDLAELNTLAVADAAPVAAAPSTPAILREQELDDVLVLVGGIIPDVDIPRLKEMGIRGVFLPGTPMQDIAQFIETNVRSREQA